MTSTSASRLVLGLTRCVVLPVVYVPQSQRAGERCVVAGWISVSRCGVRNPNPRPRHRHPPHLSSPSKIKPVNTTHFSEPLAS